MLLGLVSGLVACASISHGVVRVPQAYDTVFTAVLAAIQDAEFSVTAQEYATGTIDAEKRLPRAAGDLLQMTVRLTQAPTGVTVVATVIPPAGPLATGEKPCKCHVKRFVAALEARIPEVQLVAIQ
jgi:S-adenosylmethionine synthetase